MNRLNEYDTHPSVDEFVDNVSPQNDVYDVLVRGAAEDFVPDWSDIDLTVVAEDVTFDLLRNIHPVHQRISEEYDMKVSVTTVSRYDIEENEWHHHGDKPLAYNVQLPEAISVEGRQYDPSIPDVEGLPADSYYRMSMLMHDLRKRMVESDFDTIRLDRLCVHSLKRTKHIVRSGMEVFGQVDFSYGDVEDTFGTDRRKFLERIDRIRRQWADEQFRQNELESLLSEDIDFVEDYFDTTMRRMQEEVIE